MTVLSVRMGTQFRWIGRYPSGRWREALHLWEEIHVSGFDLVVTSHVQPARDRVSGDDSVAALWAKVLQRAKEFGYTRNAHSFSFDLNVTVSGANFLRVERRVRDSRFAFVTYRHPTKGALGIWGSNLSGSELHLTHELGARAGVALINETALGALSWPS